MEFCPECGSQLIYLENSLLCPCCSYSICCCEDCNGSKKGVENVQSKNRTETDQKVVLLKISYAGLGMNKPMTEIVREVLNEYIPKAVKKILKSGGNLYIPDELIFD